LHIGTDPEGWLAAARARHGADIWISSRSGVSDAELAVAYRDCLCFAIPSLYEGFGLPLLEAQALGAPAIASDRGSLPEVGGKGALYVDPTDPAAIAAAIGELIDSPMRRQALRVAGFANQARFSWERTARTTWKLLLENGAGSPAQVENA
jgi:glycosyltransferase involved in cell wall biosynthesis